MSPQCSTRGSNGINSGDRIPRRCRDDEGFRIHSDLNPTVSPILMSGRMGVNPHVAQILPLKINPPNVSLVCWLRTWRQSSLLALEIADKGADLLVRQALESGGRHNLDMVCDVACDLLARL